MRSLRRSLPLVLLVAACESGSPDAGAPQGPPVEARASARAPAGSAAAPDGLALGAEVGQPAPESREAYAAIEETGFRTVAEAPVSTFSVDVDTASYSNVRRLLAEGRRPPAGAVRIEELVNYFPYAYPEPTDGHPFAVDVETAACPWRLEHRLVRIGLKGTEVRFLERRPVNLVFLLDVSGSMESPDKLPLLKGAMGLLVEQMEEQDRVAIVVYAGAAGLALPPTSGADKGAILDALDALRAGGSTNGGAGIELAYRTASEGFVEGGVNRVVLCTDGDFNVGVSSDSELVRMIQEQARSGVFLSVLGFGRGNLQDAKMEQLADRGNGNYAYVDGLREARKVLVEQMGGTLVTIAKDVKVQVEFNPSEVAAYRLLGYENRRLEREDFNDDRKDAGEIGAGHTVTALYELVPAGQSVPLGSDPLKYQAPPTPSAAAGSGELCTVKLRYKRPDGDASTLLEVPVRDGRASYAAASAEFKFAAAVAAFGMLLRDSAHKGNATWDGVLELAGEGLSHDPGGHRRGFLDLVRQARQL